MKPWEEIDRVEISPDAGELILRKRDTEFSIRTCSTELMNSRSHGSEAALAELTCKRLRAAGPLKILIGGLGMGYTLAAALAGSPADTRITIAEIIPAVVRWNQVHLAHLAGRPLDDPRVEVVEEDVARTLRREPSAWNAIMLDVDNGPDGLTRKGNKGLYSRAGLKAIFTALQKRGILSVWSYGPDQSFTRRLNRCGFLVETTTVPARESGKGRRHTIWLAVKG